MTTCSEGCEQYFDEILDEISDNNDICIVNPYQKLKYHERPPLNQLENDLQHPELLSTEYTYRVNSSCEAPKEFLSTFTHLDIDNQRLFTVATNDFTSARFSGNIVGTEDLNSIVEHDLNKADFVIPVAGTITALKFVNKDSELLAVATANNEVKLWSTRNAFRPKNSPFDCGGLTLEGYASSLESLGKNKLVTGSRKGYLYICDYGIAELTLDHHFNYGFPITGIAAHPTSSDIFAFSSADRNCVIWDMRKNFPASSALRKYKFQLTAIDSVTTNGTSKLILGDEIGNVIVLDPRVPYKILAKIRVAKRGIDQISCNGSNLIGVITKESTNILKIEDNGNLQIVQHYKIPRITYSMAWDMNDDKAFYLVGEKQYAEKITIIIKS